MSAYKPDTPIRHPDGRTAGHIRWRSIADYAQTLRMAEGGQRSSNKGEGYTFALTHDATEYGTMLRDGWQAGVKGVEGLEGLSTDSFERLTFERSVGGAFPIVPAHLAGRPDSMLAPVMRTAESVRGLTLVMDCCFSGGVDAQAVIKHAQSVMRLVAWLMAERIETAVYAVIPVQLGESRYVYTTAIREAGQVMQPERIAAIAHPSFLRRAYFSMLEHEYHDLNMLECENCRHGYGVALDIKAAELQAALPESYSVIVLPKPGGGDPMDAVKESHTFKLRRGEL